MDSELGSETWKWVEITTKGNTFLIPLMSLHVLRFHFSDGYVTCKTTIEVLLHDESASRCFLSSVSYGFRAKPTDLEVAETTIRFS
jgi:hypothetical protein